MKASKRKTAAQLEREASNKAEKQREAVADFLQYALPNLGKFVRFTFIREIKQRTGISQEQAEMEFEKAVNSGAIEFLYLSGGVGGVAVYEARKKV